MRGVDMEFDARLMPGYRPQQILFAQRPAPPPTAAAAELQSAVAALNSVGDSYRGAIAALEKCAETMAANTASNERLAAANEKLAAAIGKQARQDRRRQA